MKLYKMVFFLSMIMGTMIAISSYSWFSMWMGLEINLLSIIPLMSKQMSTYSSESSMKYFITQAMASLVILMSVIMMLISEEFINPQMNFYFSLTLNSALLMKLGAAPFHFWFPEVMEGLSWGNCIILLTWQKIAPMILIMNNKMTQKFTIMIIILSLMTSTMMALNQISLRKIMTFSSINHIAWMLATTMISVSTWTIYFLIYTFTTISIINMFKMTNSFYVSQLAAILSENKMYKTSFMMNFMSLGGLPPFIGFLPKWLVISWLTKNSLFMLATMMIMLTLIMLFIYLRISFSALMMNLSEPKSIKKNPQNKITSWLNFANISTLAGCTMIFNLT